MGPGLYFNKDNGVAVCCNYINFPAACPPVSGYNCPVFTGKILRDLFFTGITGFFLQLRF